MEDSAAQNAKPRRALLSARGQAAVSLVLMAAVVAAVIALSDRRSLMDALSSVSAWSAALAFGLLALSTATAALRVRLIAGDMGYPLRWREAALALSFGNIAGAFFFQVAGQLIARSAFLGSRGVPVEATVFMVGYERAVALLVSLGLAAAGAWYTFGRFAFEIDKGGAELLKLAAGLAGAVLLGAAFGWGGRALKAVAGLTRRGMALPFIRNVIVTVAIQLMTLAAYVAIARTMAPDVPVIGLMAACTVVMLGASLPISFAGWGVRELSAVVVLAAIGVPAAAALVTAALVGAASLLALAGMAFLSAWAASPAAVPKAAVPEPPRVDYGGLVALTLPLIVATMIFFQVHIPTRSGGLNLNLADPFAILGGGLFVVLALRQRQWPRWRLSGLNAHVLIATALVTDALLLGAARFGWTDWALVNKYSGWFVLLAYAASGALAGRSPDGLKLVLPTFAVAGAAVIGVEFVLLATRNGGVHIPPDLLAHVFEGFAGNRNAFAFQVLMLAAVAIALPSRALATALLAVALAGLLYTGSRSGWIALAVLLGAAAWVRAISVRETLVAAVCAAALVAVSLLPIFLSQLDAYRISEGSLVLGGMVIDPVPNSGSVNERVESLKGGLAMFARFPVFGAGLGAFMQERLGGAESALVIHSTPLWLMAEMGLVGLLAFVIPAVRIFERESGRVSDSRASRLIVLILIAFAAMALAHEMLYQRALWFLLGALLCEGAQGPGGRTGRS